MRASLRHRRNLWGLAILGLILGCTPRTETGGPYSSPSSPPVARRGMPEQTGRHEAAAGEPEVSWDTDRDRTFARFLQEKSGGMIRKAAVGIENRGVLRIELARSVAPDDTLPLTKSVMAGARKDFPDRKFTMTVFDPTGEPILKARYQPGSGVHYQIVHGDAKARPDASAAESTLERSGVTEADRKFAAWAEDHGRAYLRYVQADLERHGRLWFGVTPQVKPDDVPKLTRSLLEGAQK